jgi:hypothetical protein
MMMPLREELFWDINFSSLDPKLHKRLIIERVLTLGNLEEFLVIEKLYDKKILVDAIKQLGYLDPKTLSFVISYYGIKISELKCYTLKQSGKTHWH